MIGVMRPYDIDTSPGDTWAGLCASCAHADVIVSSKGSSFYRCMLAEVDAAFRRYPVLPVLVCPGYTRTA